MLVIFSGPGIEILVGLGCLLIMSNRLQIIDNGMVATSGQQGKPLDLEFDQLNLDEQAVLTTLRHGGDKMKIRAIVEANGWDQIDKAKGNSKVRNALRRLVRSGLVMHNTAIGDGTYVASDIGSVSANPIQVHKDDLSPNIAYASKQKRSDCSFYNACLDQAINGKWAGFSCESCRAYSEPDEFQKEQNILGLRAVQVAADLVSKHGKVNRIRGVKPGAESKRRMLKTISF